jgi:peptidoglycan/LPS O-acetylase OafA/YrhL
MTQSGSALQVDYVPGVDGMRALAVFLVMAFHARAFHMGQGGAVGVEVFFVISGFLITRLLLAEHQRWGDINILNFHLRRLARLYPVLLMFLAVVFVASPWLDPRFKINAEIGLAGLYLYNFADELLGRELLLRHLWTLGVEMQFYLLWPFVLVAIFRFQKSNMVTVLGAMLVLSVILRLLLASGNLPRGLLPGLHIPPFLIGAMLASGILHGRRFTELLGWLGMVIIIAAALLPRNLGVWPTYLALTLVDVASAALILACLGSGMLRSLLSHWLPAQLGLWSYGIYVWHYPIFRVLREEMHGIPTLLVGAACTLLVAALSYRFLEVPLRRELQFRINQTLGARR